MHFTSIKIFKNCRDKRHVNFKGAKVLISCILQRNDRNHETYKDSFKVLKGSNCPAIILYSAKIFCKAQSGIKMFSDKQNERTADR